MVVPLLCAARRPGPAAKTFYPDLVTSPDIESSGNFRLAFSNAFSRTHLLVPHAIVRSYFEQKPLWDYRDPEMIMQVSNLYPPMHSPLLDLGRAKRSVCEARFLYHLTRTPQLLVIIELSVSPFIFFIKKTLIAIKLK
jgi:hypothetical protein